MIADPRGGLDGFRVQWPFAARYAWVNGWRMHYIDEGAGDPVMLLHGNPTWGFLYRRVIPPLVDAGHRVIVPDMIGFGLSEKPAREQAHSLDGHIANLAGLVRQLDLRRLTVVCHDWGGPTGLSFAMSNQERIRALAVMSTWAWPTPPAEFHTRLFPWRIMHAPLIGPYLMGRHNVLASRGGVSIGRQPRTVPSGGAGRVRGGLAGRRDASSDLGVATMDTARRLGPRPGAVRLAGSRTGKVSSAGPDHLGT
jgi:pimeloyl-ACP methyl ester carboxylesterase